MSATVQRFIDVAGFAIVIGLVARFGPGFATAVTAGGRASAEIIRQLTLAEVPTQNP